jgi:hypothetical protein
MDCCQHLAKAYFLFFYYPLAEANGNQKSKILPSHLWCGIEKQEKGFSQNKFVIGRNEESSTTVLDLVSQARRSLCFHVGFKSAAQLLNQHR